MNSGKLTLLIVLKLVLNTFILECLERSLNLLARCVPKIVDDLKECCWRDEWSRELIVNEFAEYLEFAETVDEEMSSSNILAWWKPQIRWSNLQKVVLHLATFTVSSACVERSFSLLANGFEKGDQHLEDYVETSVMLAYNVKRRESEMKKMMN